MVLVKNLKVFHRFFQGQFGLEKVFGDALYRKLKKKVAKFAFFQRSKSMLWSKI